MEDNSKNEILEAINSFANHVEERFNAIDGRFEKIDGRFEKIEGRFEKIEGRLDTIDSRVNRVEALMVTKDYLDDKLADLKGDLVVMLRKEDEKLGVLVEILKNKEVISNEEAHTVLSMRPFPSLSSME